MQAPGGLKKIHQAILSMADGLHRILMKLNGKVMEKQLWANPAVSGYSKTKK